MRIPGRSVKVRRENGSAAHVGFRMYCGERNKGGQCPDGTRTDYIVLYVIEFIASSYQLSIPPPSIC